jgi:uncharacterized protein GlcG (DUF336 family)
MKYQNVIETTLAACLFVASSAYAQELPDVNAVPNQLPFNYPSGTPITLEKAQALIQAGIAESNKRGWPENYAVVDWSGNLVAFARMDGAQLGSISIAEHKARTAAEFRRPTKSWQTAIQKFGLNYILTFDDMMASPGGIPLVENGKIVGAIGCSGGTSSQDEVLCQAVMGPPYKTDFSATD